MNKLKTNNSDNSNNCPVSGEWQMSSKAKTKRFFKKGDMMPAIDNKNVCWVLVKPKQIKN